MTGRRLRYALACYAALALIAVFALTDYRLVVAVLVLLAGLAVLSFTAYLRARLEDK